MSFTSRYYDILRVLQWPAMGGALLIVSVLAVLYTRLPQPDAVGPSLFIPPPAWPEPMVPADLDWSLFRGRGGADVLGEPDFVKNFRFAGTFFVSNGTGIDVRKAVLGVISESRQVIASEGDVVADVTVLTIFSDHVVLKQGAEEAELWLSFGSRESQSDAADTRDVASTNTASRFGERIADDRWKLSRESLMDYYNELLDSPERLLKVFDSLKPLYDDNGRIEGYQVGIEGEQAFLIPLGFVRVMWFGK